MNIKGLILLLALLFSMSTQATPEKPDTDSVDGDAGLPIVLTLFLHDQLEPTDIAGLGPDYLEWFIKELTQASGRRVQVISVTHTPGLTDFGYRQDNELKSLNEWYQRVVDYIEAKNLPMKTKRHKYILITRHKITSEVFGAAFREYGVAIASIKAYNTIGHEIGHMFDAHHDNAETRWAALPPCRTLMYPTHTEFFANCFVFTDKNRQAISDYINDKPKR